MSSNLGLDFTILHYFLRDKKFALEVSKEVKPEFLDSRVQVFFSALLANFVDPSVREVLSIGALLDFCSYTGLSAHAETFKSIYQKAQGLTLGGEVPSEQDFRYYLKKLKSRRNVEIARNKFEALQDLFSAPVVGPDEVNRLFKEAVTDINSLNQIDVFDEGSVGEDVDNMIAEYYAIEKDPTPFRGVTVGFPSLDNITNGFHKGELSVICGMEGSGKSLLMMNMGINAWLGTNTPGTADIARNGHNVLYFSLEMPRSNKGEYTQGAYLNKRVLTAVSELEFYKIRNGSLSDLEKEHLIETADFLKKYEQDYNKLYVADIPRGTKVSDIESKFLEVREKMEVDLVIIDYMGIMSCEGEVPDHLAQGHIAEGLHEFARTYNLPVVTAAQLNRPQGSKGQSLDNQSYNNTRLARSAMIGQNANNVFMIATRDGEETKDDMLFHITKMRDGKKECLVFTKAFNKMKVYDGSPFSAHDPEVITFEDLGIPNEA